MKRRAIAVALVLGLASSACGAASTPRPQLLLELQRLDGFGVDLEVVDETDELIGARAVPRGEMAFVEHDLGDRRIAVIGGATPTQVRLAWVGTSCDENGRLTIAPQNTITVTPGPIPGCDVIAERRAVILTFRYPVDPASVLLELGPTVQLGPAPDPGEGVGG